MYEGDANALADVVSEQLHVPTFPASARTISCLETPRHFYNTLKHKIMQANHRIFISTLYIGSDERELAVYLCRALKAKPQLQLTVLMDAMRATRESPKSTSGASLLAHLATMFPDQVDLRLYTTPVLHPRSWKAKMIGRRFNEGFGLQHMKLYGFDDDVLISGANLSRDYFTRRKDRYMLIRSHAPLADYLHGLVLLVSRFSYRLQYAGDQALLKDVQARIEELDDSSHEHRALTLQPFSMEWDGGNGLLLSEDADGTIVPSGLSPPFSTFPERHWAGIATRSLQKFTRRWVERTKDLQGSSERRWPPAHIDTRIVPLLQMGQLKITQETDMIPHLSAFLDAQRVRGDNAARPYTTVDMTSGYFSLSGLYRSLVLSEALHGLGARTRAPDAVPVAFRLIAAAPEANGFFGSRGVSRRIPAAYTFLERLFWDQVEARNLDRPLTDREPPLVDESDSTFKTPLSAVELREWRKYGWTYHQKGIWVSPPSKHNTALRPTITIIGSSNYGSRSERLDLECSLLITTTADSLRNALANEVSDMRYDARDIMKKDAFEAPDRKVGVVDRFLTKLLKSML